ncbi:unnamed protein product [Closterium sp. NIES-65]|nr:unnamed protein product [Closterium sp. NIES-65]
MGSFLGHTCAGTVMLIFASWNLFCAIRAYLAAPHAYVARAWHPVPIRGHWVRLVVYVLICGAFAQLMEGLLLGLLSAFEHRFEIIQFEHALLFAVFVTIGLIFYVHDTSSLLPLPPGSLHIIYAIGFFSEAILTTFHSISHKGLEPRFHLFQALAAVICFLLALLVAAFPSCFLLDAMFFSGFLFQGLWLWTMSLFLYGVLHLPGCRNVDYKMVKCETEVEEHLGVALAGILFIAVLVFTMLLALALYARAARNAPRSSIDYILALSPNVEASQKEAASGNIEAGIDVNGEKDVQVEGAAAVAATAGPKVPLTHAVVNLENESAALLGGKIEM